MESIVLAIVIVVLLFVLGKSARMVEGTFVLIARSVKISEFIIGFVILSVVTSLPELSIAVVSSQQGIPELSIGNEIGSTVMLLTLVVGINAIRFKKISFKGKFSEREILIGVVSILFMLIAILDKYISVLEGAFMIFVYAIYVIYLNYKYARNAKLHDTFVSSKKIYKTLGAAALGILILIVSSVFIVKAAHSLAFNLNISPALIGIFLLAVGTNIPELTISLTSKAKKKDEEALSVGNVLGSLFFNPATVGFLVIIAGGVHVPDLKSLTPALIICFMALTMFTIFSYTRNTLSKMEGFMLIGAYISLILTELSILVFDL